MSGCCTFALPFAVTGQIRIFGSSRPKCNFKSSFSLSIPCSRPSIDLKV
uniref:Uncharacterized protein n=1 Tax=Anguilla anguilla TaxID=7936 RepID=A0A0E9WR04_ANGAN